MCLAVPAEVLEIFENTAIVSTEGLKYEVYINLLPEVAVHQFILVHSGFGIEVINEKEALETLACLKELTYE